MMKKIAMLLVVAVCMTGRIQAELYKGNNEIGVNVGELLIEGDSAFRKDNLAESLQIGHYVTNNTKLYFSYLQSNSEIRATKEQVDVRLPSLGFQYFLGEKTFRPFVGLGVGILSANPRGADGYAHVSLTPEIGAKLQLTKSFSLNGSAGYLYDSETSKGAHNGLFTLGAAWLFNTPCNCEAKPAPVKAKVVAAAPAPAAPVVGDADKDGISDDKDKCPNTPAGVQVDKNGCPTDSDGDGVADYLDNCQGTPSGVAVDSKGCPPSAKAVPTSNWVLQGVQFETSSDKIKAESTRALDEAVDTLKANPKVRVEIQGHTDNVGKAEMNLALSDRRAVSVKKYLVSKGVAADRLETKGFGETQPAGNNKTPAGRAQNRRIEFKVLSR